ncbi:MAG: hypothetical protein H7A46_20665 [Verrucomicrobiales bacterium]|nr:hypothetical protein [Verrucomicrobiales bacterium]
MRLKYLLVALFFAVLALLLIAIANSSHTGLPLLELSLNSLIHGLGGMIALSAGFLMLVRAAGRDSLASMLPLVLPLLAGLLMVHPHWSLGLVLAIAVAGVLLRDLLPASGSGGGSNPPRRFRRGGGDRDRDRDRERSRDQG